MKTRREFLIAGGAGLCVLAAPLASLAQQKGKVWRIGFLGAASSTDASFVKRVDAVRAGLRDLGYVEGKNIVIEYRWAEGKYERLPDLAAELVRLKVDVIISHGSPGPLAAKRVTTTIPIVFAASADAVAIRLISSLARPGGNITGNTFFLPELSAKRLEILRDALPKTKRVGVLFNRDNPAHTGPVSKAIEQTAGSLKLDLHRFGVRGPGEFDNAFGEMATRKVDAVLVIEDPMIVANFKGIADLAAKKRPPSISSSEAADAGCLMAYGVNLLEMYRGAGVFVDKILKGARPGDIPVEQATRFELLLNLKTAKAVGIKFPQSILMRADRVIE